MMDIIELTSSSEDEQVPPVRLKLDKPFAQNNRFEELRDESILILDEPRSARNPVRKAGLTQLSPTSSSSFKSPVKHTCKPSDATETSPSKAVDDSQGPSSSTLSRARIPLAVPQTPKKALNTPVKTPRTSKKAVALAAQAQREEYAQSLFDEFNRIVFDGGLPPSTKLTWSKRLLTTAGRARWHRQAVSRCLHLLPSDLCCSRSKDGVHTTEIELATKILDSNERIRNTLSHEMCHLACWIINQDPKEGHGRAWKSWAAKVMRKRPEIDITVRFYFRFFLSLPDLGRQTRHDYEISYPYEWECEKCEKIYGRFSKSIRADEVVCGACKIGTLVPLFSVRTRATAGPKTPNTKAASKLAGKARVHGSNIDSPIAPLSPFTFDADADEDRMLAKIVGSLRLDAA
ncbi:hypothetical protein EWM64_g6781 [Hericium alpestre]|uniref:SprT-like domain-containing protein n=1 Tax=Hericium alpestre TaxID=135208 RepID=A0A4Y9ZTS8_9AGAM|nr:hypothetical protein EWM64_g6781 [Hericium alpestre]